VQVVILPPFGTEWPDNDHDWLKHVSLLIWLININVNKVVLAGNKFFFIVTQNKMLLMYLYYTRICLEELSLPQTSPWRHLVSGPRQERSTSKMQSRNANCYTTMLSGASIQPSYTSQNKINFCLCLIISVRHYFVSHRRQEPILNGSHHNMVQLEMLCFWTPIICLQVLNWNAIFQKQICFSPHCGLFYVPDSTQTTSHQ
jgi:hypothetical protein